MRQAYDRQSPSEVIAVSKACVEALVRLYYCESYRGSDPVSLCVSVAIPFCHLGLTRAERGTVRHGFSGFDSTSCQFQWLMGEAAVEALAKEAMRDDIATASSSTTIEQHQHNTTPSREEILSTLVLGAVGLRESGRFSFIAQGLLQVLQSRLSPRERLLLGRFLTEETPGVDMQATMERYNQSNLPVNLFSMKLEPDQTLKKSLVSSAVAPSIAGDGNDDDDSDDEMTTLESN